MKNGVAGCWGGERGGRWSRFGALSKGRESLFVGIYRYIIRFTHDNEKRERELKDENEKLKKELKDEKEKRENELKSDNEKMKELLYKIIGSSDEEDDVCPPTKKRKL